MTNYEMAGEVKAFTRVLSYDELLSGAVGAQDAVTVHPILPEGWTVFDVHLETRTAFNGTGTRTVDVGFTSDGDALVADEDVKSAAFAGPTVTKKRSTTPEAITVTLTTATDNPTAGELAVTVLAYPAAREE